jgi:hypothetical protein
VATQAQEKTNRQSGPLFVKQEDNMTDKKEPLKVVFEPGCFDHFDGTQEELDGLMAEIQDMFSNMTPEELKAQSRAIDIDELAEALDNDPELLEAMKHISDLDKRNLQ